LDHRSCQSCLQEAVRTMSLASKHPTTLGLISSDDPAQWTKLIDMSAQLPAAVKEFNEKNPASKITLLGKAEFANPGMSHKDRIAKVMLQRAEARGDLTTATGEKKTILAASSGNTGCSLALVGTLMGYQVVIITNAKCSTEKCQHIQSNGATLWMAEELKERAEFASVICGEKDYMKQEDLLAAAYPDRFYSVNQYGNPDNMEAHHDSTGREIYEQTGGAVTHFVMAASTGGTIMGVGKYLKERLPAVQVVLADPDKSHLAGLLEGRKDQAAGAEALAQVDAKIKAEGGVLVEGAGKNALTDIMARDGGVLAFVDSAVAVDDFDAFDECRATASCGLLVGGSAGLNICAAKRVAAQCALEAPRPGGVCIVTLLCDHGIKYLTKVYNDEWLAKNDKRPKPLS